MVTGEHSHQLSRLETMTFMFFVSIAQRTEIINLNNIKWFAYEIEMQLISCEEENVALSVYAIKA